MEPIIVPAPPKQAFNKNRRISDLIRAQVTHLKHVEESLPSTLRSTVPQGPITTESDAANYIASMTNLFRTTTLFQGPLPIIPITAPVIVKPATPVPATSGLSIAASAPVAKKKTKPKKAATKKSKAPTKPKAAKPKKRKK